jgi:ubiquinone biosynthesis protein Coq4
MNIYSTIKKGRSTLLVYLTHKMALPLLKHLRKPVLFPFSMEELKQFPDNTMGKDLAVFIEKKGLDLLPYYAKHDIKHILLDYDTTDDGEVCLQCFMLGNRHVSFPVLATVMYGFVTMPEYWSLFRKAFRRGRGCGYIESWKWFEILREQTSTLKNKVQ